MAVRLKSTHRENLFLNFPFVFVPANPVHCRLNPFQPRRDIVRASSRYCNVFIDEDGTDELLGKPNSGKASVKNSPVAGERIGIRAAEMIRSRARPPAVRYS